MAKATFQNTVIAESDQTEVVEGNHYFPPASLRREFLEDSAATSFCPWKGTAQYYDVVVDGQRAAGAAWYYPEPKEAASRIKNHVAFWKDVTITD